MWPRWYRAATSLHSAHGSSINGALGNCSRYCSCVMPWMRVKCVPVTLRNSRPHRQQLMKPVAGPWAEIGSLSAGAGRLRAICWPLSD